MPDKIAMLVENLGLILGEIQKSNSFFNDVKKIDYGVTSYDNNSFSNEEYPRIQIICNNVSIPEFTTTSSKVQVEVTINGYLRKKKDIETDLGSYQESVNWSNDLRKGVANWLKQIPEEIDGDLIDNQIQQTIGFPLTLLTCTTEFGIIFDECY